MSVRSHDPLQNARLAGYTRGGFAGRYHAYRPRPPLALVELLQQMAQTSRPDLVVDLGSGTGLSTALWAAHARRVVGIEPLDEMRGIADAMRAGPHVEFRAGVAQQTGLPAGAADIVTCAQSFHHMEPQGVLVEVARILRPGGVFATYDYDWPPVVHPEAELAFFAFMDRIRELRAAHGIRSEQQQWDKTEHADRMQSSGAFRLVREVLLHRTERCTAEHWVGFALTLGHVIPVLDLGLSDAELGLDELRRVSERTLGAEGLPWYVSYRVRIGVKLSREVSPCMTRVRR
jgi:ubiquinone/menaquinone biosynthesis C-methylase UbiE